ncbi:response regulator transcription factor [Parasegetibacter sp. NRK P23]|uniref:response regulator n=1 Tax=Parasegetibacter sp. NRK P23 TaxID=2942999 RepID=UPI002044C966|nr:response regulator transcription factor [Parasegetibacter sp. NRK P23]MCM5530457.1 response regulator transcription factor [Parasegetibacter sp. NRK P23]
MVSILIYEDNASLREGLCNLIALTDDFTVSGAFPDCSRLNEHLEMFHPDVILMDIDMPGINGIEAVKRIRLVNNDVQIIMLTVFDDNNHVFNAVYAGANGYLLKKFVSDRLLGSIREVLRGGAPMSPSIARMVIENMQQSSSPNDYQLTAREKDILHSLAKGNSYKLIANDLGISIETVRTHIKHIYDKLHVSSQAEALSKAFRERLV